jgi:hypothetical protein
MRVLDCPQSGVESPTPGGKTATLARPSARPKVATAKRRGRAVANRLGSRRPPAVGTRPEPSLHGRRPAGSLDAHDRRRIRRGDGTIRRSTGWRGVRAGWPDRSSVAAEQADAEPAVGSRLW